MKNNTLTFSMIFSALIFPLASNAGTRIEHKGALSVSGKDSIVLSQHAGKSIVLNKGAMELRTEKVSMGFSIFDPQLIVVQNGKSLAIDIPTGSYHGSEAFTYLGKDSGLNYDLYLRKTEVKGNALTKVEEQICTYREWGFKCGVDINGAYNCVQNLMDRTGTQKAKNTYVDVTTTYKLTLGQNNVSKAEFTSSTTQSNKTASEELSRCQ